jgi:hypothetical protein
MRVTNGIHLGCPLLLPVDTVNYVQTLKVWGGGHFLPDAWYDACDELGIMVYHDMQYAQHGHSPTASLDQDAELRHIIRRLSAHTSIVVYDGCNECTVIIGTALVFEQNFALEDAIGSHTCSLEASKRVTNRIFLECPLPLTVHTFYDVTTLKARPLESTPHS